MSDSSTRILILGGYGTFGGRFRFHLCLRSL